MNLKIIIILGVVLGGAVALQTWRLGTAQEAIGGLEAAVAVQNAQAKERDRVDTLVTNVKAAIHAERNKASRALARTNQQIKEALDNVQTNTCYDDRSTVPVQHVRVLNGSSVSGPQPAEDG